MKYTIAALLIIVHIASCAMNAPQSSQKMSRLNELLTQLQNCPSPKTYTGDFENYRESRLKEVEDLIRSREVSTIGWPIKATTRCCLGYSFLYYAAKYNLPVLSLMLATQQILEHAGDAKESQRLKEEGKKNIARAFWIAAYSGHDQVIQALLHYNEYMDWQDENAGERGTPLHNAVFNGHRSTVEKIVKHCVAEGKKNILIATDRAGNTPLDYALTLKKYDKKEDPEMVAILLDAIHG